MNGKIVSTQELRAIIKNSERRGFSRLPVELIPLDPNGKHVLNRCLQENDFVRCYAMAKLMGRKEPAEFFLDVEVSQWDLIGVAVAL